LWSDGNEATFVEFGVPYGQSGVCKVDVAHGQVERLAGSQTSSV
jgi:hypothetical protein